jgi:iron complex outermembrane receptor protein
MELRGVASNPTPYETANRRLASTFNSTTPMFRSLTIGACAVLIAAPVVAQTPTTPAHNSDSTAKSLGAVVVSATRATTTVDRIALHATLVTQDEIKKSPAQTLDQLLRDVPGLNIPGAP